MVRIVETTVYQFAELSDDAKERARDWYRGLIDASDAIDTNDWQAIAAILGIDFDNRRGTREAAVYWSYSCSQGDGANWQGSYAYAKAAPRRIREYAPNDKTLHAIADSLQAAQRRNFYQLSATVTPIGRYYSLNIDVTDYRDRWRDVLEQDSEAIKDAMRAFADWIFEQVRDMVDWLYADAQVDDCIIASGYEFDSDGNIA